MCRICSQDYSKFTSLTILNVNGFKSLTSIPDTLTSLTTLGVSSTSLTSIPNTLTSLTHVDASGCTWLDPKIKEDNIAKLITLQRFVKRNMRVWIFGRWIKSREFVELFYHPDNIGGRMAKKELENMVK